MHVTVLQTWLGARLHLGEHDERGANLVEYMLLIAFVTLVVIVSVKRLGGMISSKYSSVNAVLQ
jgi:Flp pilus assembly pilin Flp